MSPSGLSNCKQVFKLPRFKAESFIANCLCTDYFKAVCDEFCSLLQALCLKSFNFGEIMHFILNRNFTSLDVGQIRHISASGYINQLII